MFGGGREFGGGNEEKRERSGRIGGGVGGACGLGGESGQRNSEFRGEERRLPQWRRRVRRWPVKSGVFGVGREFGGRSGEKSERSKRNGGCHSGGGVFGSGRSGAEYSAEAVSWWRRRREERAQ